MAGDGDTPAPMLGRATAVLEKLGGSWKIAVLHFSR
jgi:ketosteroid isomerase-like protein